MADNTISTSRQSCKPDCNQLNIIEQPIMNKYSEIDESPSTDTDEPVQGMSVASKLNITKMIQNKLKRKKKLSTSLTSVSDVTNPEKRTRIEGIHLNCRGKLNEELIAAATTSSPSSVSPSATPIQMKLERVQSRTPLPSPRVAEKIILLQQSHQQQSQQQMAKVPPPRLKRKLEENVVTIQKLNAQTDQMRLEIAELKSHLTTERGAVRVLRAQNESESRKWKNEVKKLQTAMELMRKVKKSKEEACANWAGNSSSSSSANGTKDANITNHELQRLTNEITNLREANKHLEEKLQISNDAERRKAADLRELKDSYEIRLTQLSKSAKTEISRLLEEIKTKERNIGQLKKETQTLQKLKTNQTTNFNNKKDTHTKNAAQHPSEMKKLKDIERNKNNSNTNNNNCNITNKNNTNTEKCFLNTTCGEKEFHSMPHEFTERILEAHNDVHAYRSKQDHQHSDSDSALSSAPPSISPQPPPNGMEPADIWQTIRNYTKDIEKVQNDLESIQKENESLQKELNLAKQQILESEKTAMEATNNAKKQHKLLDRIKCLEQRENELQEETHELREQNELLEFRILELEESNDKWSLQSNATPNRKNVWNDGGKDADDAIIFTDRSDSGVTSPHSHHHIDDRINVISPCDLNLLDHMTNDDLRRRLSHMIKKPNIDEDDKICLQQVLAFIQNLDVMSHDSLPSSEESSSLEYIKSRVSDYSSSPRSSDISPTLLQQKPKSAPPTGRIVATVLPYSSSVSTPNESPQRKQRAWNTSSLTESGVFEGDLSESSVYTQTEPDDFACLETEVQQLNRFREKFVECATKSANAKVPACSLQSLSPNLSDQKRIQYYKDRLEVLESKLLIYESSGDLQAKRLADRLQREIQLENFVKELRDRVDFLEVENSQLEEEKCEFEEAENDTRLRLQRLEVELEILSQRNIELEMSREALQNKLKDCRSESLILREDLAACQTQVCHLEEDRCRYKENFEFLHSALPALVLFNTLTVTGMDSFHIPEPELMAYDHGKGTTGGCSCTNTVESFKRESLNLREEIRSLKRQIGDLNTRHTEALACADGCWEDLERSYNERLMASKSKEDSLKQKIKQLEGCIQDDSRAANEKICQLEDAERELRMCLQKVSRDHREILQEHELITEEYHRVKEKYDRLREHVDGPIKEAMEREKTLNKNLKDELGYMRRTSCEQEMHYSNELDCFQVQLDKLHKELLQIQVTNSELREEVCTLEKEVISLQHAKKEDIDKIRCLSDEVRTKEDMCAVLEKRVEALVSAPYYVQRQMRHNGRMMSASCSGAVPSLAQELNGSPVKRIKMEEPKDLQTATKNLGTVLSSIKDSARDIPSHRQFQNVANDVKRLAETLLANKSTAENKIAIMTNKKQPCNRRTCPVYKSAQESNETQTSWHTCISDSETFNETAIADGFPDEVEESNSQMTLMQKIRDPEQFMIALQNIVVLAENLLAAIEDAVREGANTLQRSISSVISPKSSVENVRENGRESRSIYCEEITVTVPLTLHIRPTVTRDWVLSEPMDEEMGESIEPIRTASISMSPGPRMMYFAEDSVHDEEMGNQGPLPEPEGTALLTPQELPLPQQKDLTLCTPCNCENCPIYDSSNAVVCPQNCGCCDCPWRGNMDPNFCHREVKICGCTQQPMNTPSSAKRCECLPNFDICACRDIAESRHVELYGTEMYPDGLIKDRDGATQNDRYRDHTNLSNQPNIEASAGLRQQPAGPNENQEAKDDEKNKRSSTDQYDIPRGSYLSSERTSECCNESSSPTLTSKKTLTRNGSALICFSTKFNDSSEEQVSGPPKYIFSEDYWAPNDSFKQNEADGRSDENVLQRSEQQKREDLDNCIESLYGLRFTSKSPSFTCITSSTRNNSSSENVETNHQEAIQSNSSEEPIFYTPRDSTANTLSTEQPTVSSDINPPYSVIETETTPTESKDDRLVQLLENIYELLQCRREDHRQRIDRPTKFETDESLNDLLPPPPPPSSPSMGGQQVQISSTPPFNIFISPMPRAEDDIVNLSQYTVENQGMDLLEPPERDIEYYQPKVGTQRLIPLDKNLLEMDSNFELDPEKESKKYQGYESSLEDSKIGGLYEEIQVKTEDFTVSEINPPTEGVNHPMAQYFRPSESQELKPGAITCCQRQDTLTEKHFLARKMETELCECVCEDPKECADTCCKFLNSISIENPSDHQNPFHVSSSIQIAHVKPEPGISQEVQVNTDSLQSVAPHTNAIPTAVTNVGTDRPQFDDEDPSTEAPICHCHQTTAKPQKPDASDFIDSILYDLKAIKKIREKAAVRPFKTGSQIHQIDLSFPVTIETVQELGPNSLFIKWKVHNCANIAGYEIFLDDRLTYRYFSRVHRAAVICNVNLKYPHIIILRAQPQHHTKPSSLACNSKLFTSATTQSKTINAAESYPQPDGSIWYPSVFHFEPNFYSAPANTSFDDCCAAKC